MPSPLKRRGESQGEEPPSSARALLSSMNLIQYAVLLAFFGLWVQLLLILLAMSSSTSSNNASLVTMDTLSPQEPIILMGLPRSGSLAFHQYFSNCHGKFSAHYCCGNQDLQTKFPCDEPKDMCGDCVLKNLQNHQPAFENCGATSTDGNSPIQVWSRFDLETSDAWFLPQHFTLGLLHEAYPNATWILNTRGSSRQWAESVLHWHSMTRRFFATYNLDLYPSLIPPPPDKSAKISPEELEVEMSMALKERVYNRTEHTRKRIFLERLYQNHTHTIQLWAQQFPTHQLIEINVDDEDGTLNTLTSVFGIPKTEEGQDISCQWSCEHPDDDWKDFSLPFDSPK